MTNGMVLEVDFVVLEVSFQAQLAGSAKAAVEATPDLARKAEGSALALRNPDRLYLAALGHLPEKLLRAVLAFHPGNERRHRPGVGLFELLPKRLGKARQPASRRPFRHHF
jgi:hypothetical protein